MSDFSNWVDRFITMMVWTPAGRIRWIPMIFYIVLPVAFLIWMIVKGFGWA